MNIIDKIIGYITFCFIFLISMLCLGWWSFYSLNYNVFYGAIIGLILGITINIIFLKKIINNLFSLNYIFLAIIYILYSIFIFGFFMGVPIFNILMGILLGWYMGRRMQVNNIEHFKLKKAIKNGNIFGLIVLSVICVISAYIAR
jgi:hypothetical protein